MPVCALGKNMLLEIRVFFPRTGDLVHDLDFRPVHFDVGRSGAVGRIIGIGAADVRHFADHVWESRCAWCVSFWPE